MPRSGSISANRSTNAALKVRFGLIAGQNIPPGRDLFTRTMHDKVRSKVESITEHGESVMIKRGFTAMAVAGMILAGPVFGHAKLRSTLPAADAQLGAAPKSVTLTFNENVRLAV